MPFFQDTPWLSNPVKAWVWAALTIPSTIMSFAFYFHCRRRDERNQDQNGIELNLDLELQNTNVP